MPSQPIEIGAVILAAGLSSRMGSPKALLDIGGRPLIGRLVDSVQQVQHIRRTIIITGHQPQQIERACAGSSVTFIHNPDYETGGMFSSVKTGAAAMKQTCDAFFIMLLDQPLVRAKTLETMIEHWVLHRPTVLRPRHGTERGHPILLSASAIEPLLSLPADASLRDFVVAQKNELVDVNDPGVLTDVDMPQDYQKLLDLWNVISRGES